MTETSGRTIGIGCNGRAWPLLALLLAGCATNVGNARIADDARLAGIQEGRSTMAEVRVALGEPQRVDFPDADSTVWHYANTKARTNGAAFIPVVGFLFMKTDVQSRSVAVLFGKDGVVRRVGVGNQREVFNPVTGAKAAAQP